MESAQEEDVKLARFDWDLILSMGFNAGGYVMVFDGGFDWSTETTIQRYPN